MARSQGGTSRARWQTGSTGLVVLALLIGAGAGVGAVAFRYLILAVTRLATGHDDYSDLGRVGNPHLPWLGGWVVVVLPVLAGLVYGPLVTRFAPQARGHGVPEVMFAVSENGGRIPAPVAGVKALASALCIGAGGSVGREGPIVQIGSALGSTVGRWFRSPPARLRTLVACGAAGGIAATFNAPLAGVFFALELILADFAAEAFGAVVLSAVVASVISRSVLGDTAFLTLPPFHVHSVLEYALYALLGLLAALVARAFTLVLYGTEDACDAAWKRLRGPEWARPAVGGVLLGLLLLALPQMYGVGYPVLAGAVDGRYAVGFLLVLLVGKIVATSLTIGIGGSGGVFAPSLFLGAAAGDAFGQVFHALAPGLVTQPGAYALIGMGAVFAGGARAPITAVVILFELTGEYTIILPLMLAIVVATAVGKALSPDTIYTLKLRRRGVELGRPAGSARPETTVGQAMRPLPEPLSCDTALEDVRAALLRAGSALPVVDADGAYCGVVTMTALEVVDPDGTAGELAAVPASPVVGDPLDTAVALLSHPDGSGGLPVLDDEGCPVGWVDHVSVVRALAGQVTPVA